MRSHAAAPIRGLIKRGIQLRVHLIQRIQRMSKESYEVDVLVLGAGSAGTVARRAAKSAGASVLLCDGGILGTTCARVGCMPSKLLIAPSTLAREVKKAHLLGLHVDDVRIDGPAVMQRVRAERDRFVGFVEQDMEAIPEDERLWENVRFVEPGIAQSTSGKTIHYKAAVVSTGTTPFIPDPLPKLSSTLYTSDSIFEIQDIPKRLAVIGAGVIGIELGQAFAGLGSDVTIIARDEGLGILKDKEVWETFRSLLAKDVRLLQNASVTHAEERDGVAHLSWTHGDEENFDGSFDAVLVATGRRASFASVGLENLGIEANSPRDLNLDEERLQIGTHPIFLAGDINGMRAILHEAVDEGRIAGENAARAALYGHHDARCFERRTPLGIMFGSPQASYAGQRPVELEEGTFETGSASFQNQGRSRIDLVNEGLIHIYGAKPNGRLLGFEMCGPAAEHVGHLLSWAIQQQLTVSEVLDMPFYHPTIEEGVRTALQRLARELGIRRSSRMRAGECAPTEER